MDFNPHLFIPAGMELDLVAENVRLPRVDLIIGATPPRTHEDHAIAVVNPPLAPALQGPAVSQIRDYLIHVVGVKFLDVASSFWN